MNINIGDLVTLKGLSQVNEKPIGLVKAAAGPMQLKIIWLNVDVAKRYALAHIVKTKKLEVVSEA